MKKVVNVGGGGDMGEVATKRLLHLMDDCRVVIADFDRRKADEVVDLVGSPRVEAVQVDVHDAKRLREVIRGCDLVINSTGPYYRTGRPVQEACIDERVNYIDFGDTDVASKELFSLEDRFREAGITALTCCGCCPGLTSVLIRKCILELDEVDSIESAWVTGPTPPEEGKTKGGRALIEHMIFECSENTHTLRDGELVEIPSFKIGKVVDFPEPLGPLMVFECGHAEIDTYPRFIPGLKNLHIYGSGYPPPLNGIFRGIAAQVKKGTFDMKTAVDFLFAMDGGVKPEIKGPYLGVLRGVLAQLIGGELRRGDLRALAREVMGKYDPSIGAISVTVEGWRDDRKLRMKTAFAGYQGGPQASVDMNDATGTPMAVFAYMLLDGKIDGPGVLAPEGCVDPDEFLRIIRPLNLAGLEELAAIETVEL
jgi:saccharopine dehydrogenase (NAD+, L-lysine-forming)